MKLLHKLLLGFSGVALLIWVAGYLAVHLSEEALQKAFIENTESLAREIIHNVDRDVHDKIEVFEAYLSDTILQEKLIESNHEFEKLDNIQAYIIKKDREWTSVPKDSHKWGMHKEHKTMGVHLITEKGRLIYSNNICREFLSDFSYLLPDPVYVSDAHQHIRLSGKSFINKDVTHGELFITYSYSSGYKNYKGLNWIVALVHKKKKYLPL